MGCGYSKFEEEELYLINAENELGLSYIKVELLDIYFRKYHNNGRINQSQLIQISEHLGFRILNTKKNKNIQKFYNSLKEKSSYFLKDLLLISILLGKGSQETKAKLIYEIFDEEYSHQLEIEKIKIEILERMFYHCVKTLPLLVVEVSLGEDEQVLHFQRLKRLNECVNFAADTLASSLCIRGKIISIETFAEVLSSLDNLLTPSGLRKYLSDIRPSYKQNLIESRSLNNKIDL